MAANFRKVLSKLMARWANSPPISEQERRRILRDGLKGWRFPAKAAAALPLRPATRGSQGVV
jgi:hypothetical protein